MKIVSWNVQGLGNDQHRLVVKDVLRFNQAHIAMIQVSKISSMSDKIVKEI